MAGNEKLSPSTEKWIVVAGSGVGSGSGSFWQEANARAIATINKQNLLLIIFYLVNNHFGSTIHGTVLVIRIRHNRLL